MSHTYLNMNEDFQNPSTLWAALIIDQLVKNGVRFFFCAPGMRNAPLLKAIELHPDAKSFIGFDERAQSFRALGFIRTHSQAAALVCTSGTAVANFLPAVIEAEKSRIPLIVLSADRPGELNAIDANQTIDQTEVLRDYCKHYWMCSEPQSDFPPRALSGKLSQLTHSTLSSPKGPMHINIPLREPLDHSSMAMDQKWKDEIFHILKKERASLENALLEKRIPKAELSELYQALENSQRPFIIFGPMDEQASLWEEDLGEFLESYKGSFSCDVTTGLKYKYGSEKGLIPTLDHPEVLAELERTNPDLIIHFGHRLTSKHYYKFLERRIYSDPEAKIFHICDSHQHEDPGLAFQRRWNILPTTALRAINHFLKERKEAGHTLKLKPLLNLEEMIQKKTDIINNSPLSYPVLTKIAVENLEGPLNIFMGNSTFIRSFDSYATYKSLSKTWNIIANRGASGIEGHLAMSQGIYDASQSPTVAFMGDVSFIHDLGSLASLAVLSSSAEEKREIPLLIIVANNQGGGIFKLLPIGKEENREKNPYLSLLTTPHQLDITAIVTAFGIEAKKVNSREEYLQHLQQWNKNPKFMILECLFNDEDNIRTYDQLKTVKL